MSLGRRVGVKRSCRIQKVMPGSSKAAVVQRACCGVCDGVRMNALPGRSGREVVERVYKDAASNAPAGNSSAAAMCQTVSAADLEAIQVLVETCTNPQ